MEDEFLLLRLAVNHLFPSEREWVFDSLFSADFASSPKQSFIYLARDFPGLDEATLWDAKAKKRDKQVLVSQLLPQPNTVLSRRRQKTIFGEEDDWEAFYRLFPDAPGLISLSRVGFNPTRTQALMEVGIQYHRLAGEGRIVWLQKEDQWQVATWSPSWIS